MHMYMYHYVCQCMYIYYEGTWRRSCFESVKRVHFPRPQEAMLTSCALAACRLYNAFVRKLFCVHLGRCVACTCCRASRPRALEYIIVYGQSAKSDVIPYLHSGLRGVIGTYGRNRKWEGRDPLSTCGFEEQ